MPKVMTELPDQLGLVSLDLQDHREIKGLKVIKATMVLPEPPDLQDHREIKELKVPKAMTELPDQLGLVSLDLQDHREAKVMMEQQGLQDHKETKEPREMTGLQAPQDQ